MPDLERKSGGTDYNLEHVCGDYKFRIASTDTFKTETNEDITTPPGLFTFNDANR